MIIKIIWLFDYLNDNCHRKSNQPLSELSSGTKWMLEVHAQVRLRSQNKRKTKHVWSFLFAVWEYLARKCPQIVKKKSLFSHLYPFFGKDKGGISLFSCSQNLMLKTSPWRASFLRGKEGTGIKQVLQLSPKMPHIGWQNKLQVCSHEVWSRVRVGLFKQVITIVWNQKFHARSKMVCWEQQFARWGGGAAEGERLHGGSNISTSAGVEMDPCQKKIIGERILVRWGPLTSFPLTWTAFFARTPRSSLTSSPGFDSVWNSWYHSI